jgi:leucyl/phenylalanyl-tRNA---protein transferase
MPIFRLGPNLIFPPLELAEENGLLAVGGDLSTERLLLAYRLGIFPWYSDPDPILWWSPDPRLVLFPHELHVSRSLQKTLRQNRFHITLDSAFDAVIGACADIRNQSRESTWITDAMRFAYSGLHRAGFAHSVEAWSEGQLVGGLYGVSLGRAFFGESMFSIVRDASKVAFVTLVDYLSSRSFKIIDCQVRTEHLMRLGAREISRERFLEILKSTIRKKTLQGKWSL